MQPFPTEFLHSPCTHSEGQNLWSNLVHTSGPYQLSMRNCYSKVVKVPSWKKINYVTQDLQIVWYMSYLTKGGGRISMTWWSSWPHRFINGEMESCKFPQIVFLEDWLLHCIRGVSVCKAKVSSSTFTIFCSCISIIYLLCPFLPLITSHFTPYILIPTIIVMFEREKETDNKQKGGEGKMWKNLRRE